VKDRGNVRIEFRPDPTIRTNQLHTSGYFQGPLRGSNGISLKLNLRQKGTFSNTEHFTDLGKFNFSMVVWFYAHANFQSCPGYLQKYCLIQKWSKLTQK